MECGLRSFWIDCWEGSKIREGSSKSLQVEMEIDKKRCLKVLWDEMLRQGDESQICRRP